MVVYLDSVFIINMMINYFLLRLTARLMGVQSGPLRCLPAAAMGGGYAVSVFFAGEWWASGGVKLALGILMCLAAFGNERHLWKLTVLFLSLSCALAGAVLALELWSGKSVLREGIFCFDADWKIFLIAAGSVWLLLRFLFGKEVSHGARGELAEVKLFHKGKSAAIRALCDTGNTLVDPMTGKGVLLVEKTVAARLLPAEAGAILAGKGTAVELLESLGSGGTGHDYFLLPYRGIGVEKGMLLGFRCERAEIMGKRYRMLPVGILPEKLNGEGCYEGLWGRNE